MACDSRFSRSEIVLGSDAIERLKTAKVIVFGIGGVGSWCAEALVRTGLGHLTLVDSDTVAASNMNRQAMATSKTLGEAKVEAMRRRLLEIAPDADIAARAERFTPETAGNFDLASFDFVIDAIDSVADKAELILRTLACGGKTRLFSSMGAALRTDPTKIQVSQFRKIEGDGLARALRGRFRKLGGKIKGDFLCVCSSEAPCVSEVAGRGSLMTVTAAFGLTLASLVLDAVRRHP